MKENIIQKKSYEFAIHIVELYKYLREEKKDFFAKLSISYKEARETHYWIRLLIDTNYLTPEKSNSYLKEIEEILKIIGSIQKTIRNS
jgi:four helix bundle protein